MLLYGIVVLGDLNVCASRHGEFRSGMEEAIQALRLAPSLGPFDCAQGSVVASSTRVVS